MTDYLGNKIKKESCRVRDSEIKLPQNMIIYIYIYMKILE